MIVALACSRLDGPLEPVRIEALAPEGPRLRAALELSAGDDAWGGWSGAAFVARDELVAVSDVGGFLRLRLLHDADGALVGAEVNERGWLRDEDGRELRGKARGDAESLAIGADGWRVGFEQDHRILRYPASFLAAPVREALPDGFTAPTNGGIEALGRVGEALLLVTEGEDGASGPHPAWIRSPGGWEARELPRTGSLRPVELTPVGDGALLVERSWSPAEGVRIRVSRLGSDLVPTSSFTLGPPDAPLDNFEAAAAQGGSLYLLSDDNQSGDQRTLLVQVRLDG